MTTYRTGSHWGVTIVREGADAAHLFGLDAGPQGKHGPACHWPAETCTGHPSGALADDQLVAVVVNGDRALAERICALLNGYQRQVRMVQHGRELLGDAPQTGPASTVAAQDGSAVPTGTPDGHRGPDGRFWGEHPPHPTCIDLGGDLRNWTCGPQCPHGAVI